MLKYINLKPEINFQDMLSAHPRLWIIMGHYFDYATKNNLPVTITSLFSDYVEGRLSLTHKSGRAVDFSIKGWPQEHLDGVVKYLNEKCGELGAVGRDGIRRCIVVHDAGSGNHAHVQCFP